ncbi:MAG: hypothetical protein KDB33_10530 [Acidimicrobiales bacterium]|nr:hypothetical protein [Acidimicrobiales bacterium]MCB1260803.1 hypothetical protein [Acidimicrobiales bacterium]
MAAATAVAVALSSIGVALGADWVPASDWALIEASVRDVGTAHTPLVGFFSRYGWFHPGPWPLYVLAVPYRLFGASPQALLIAVGLVNTAAVVVCCRASWRIGGHRLLLVTSGALIALMAGMRVWLLVDPWNPWLGLLPFAALVLCCWALALGHRWYLPAVAALATFVVQCHVAFVVPAVAVVLAALVLCVRSGGGERWRPALLAGAAVVVVGWAPVVVEQVVADGGNLAALGSFFVTASVEPTAGPVQGARILATETSGWPPWLGRPEPTRFDGDPRIGDVPDLASPWAVAVPVALVAATWYLARRRGAGWIATGAILAMVLLAGSWIGLARLAGPQYYWLVRFTWVVGWFGVVVVAAFVVEVLVDTAWLRRRSPAGSRTRAALAAAAIVAVLLAGAVAVRTGADPVLPAQTLGLPVASLRPATLDWLRGHVPPGGAVAVEGRSDERYGATQGLFNVLDAAGYDVSLRGEWAKQVREDRRNEAPVTLVVVSGDEVGSWRARGIEEVAAFEPTGLGSALDLEPTVVFLDDGDAPAVDEAASDSDEPTDG